MSVWGYRFDPSVLLQINVAFALMVLTAVVVVSVFGWQYWVAYRAYQRSLTHVHPWPISTETWLGGANATVTRIDKGRKSA